MKYITIVILHERCGIDANGIIISTKRDPKSRAFLSKNAHFLQVMASCWGRATCSPGNLAADVGREETRFTTEIDHMGSCITILWYNWDSSLKRHTPDEGYTGYTYWGYKAEAIYVNAYAEVSGSVCSKKPLMTGTPDSLKDTKGQFFP